jgi:glycosyltransferase involved in cell wall biosynthesis
MAICRQLASRFVMTLDQNNVRLLVIENGTLPDNPLFTEALYLAIDEYGKRRGLGKYVLWRDHDLMWSVDPHLYGDYPYDGVRKPARSPYIQYCVVTDWMRRRLEAWARDVSCEVISNRFYWPTAQPEGPSHSISFREAYGIPQDAYLIARCTRVVPQKAIERDLRLLAELQSRLAASGDQRKVYLFVTGPTDENPAEFARLLEVQQRLGIAEQVIWANGLLPFNPFVVTSPARTGGFSVRDLLGTADISSFLTSYDYEGFGNPPGEAMALGVPFIATSYELYEEVYGRKGAVAPLLSIKRGSAADEPIPDYFASWVLRTLTNREYRDEIVMRNGTVCRRYFSLETLAEQVRELLDCERMHEV